MISLTCLKEYLDSLRPRMMSYAFIQANLMGFKEANADDAATTAYTKCEMNILKYASRGTLPSYVKCKESLRFYMQAAIKKNIIAERRKDSGGFRSREQSLASVGDDVPDEKSNNCERDMKLHAAIQRLPDQLRQIIEGLYLDKKHLTQIAKELGMKYETCRTLRKRAVNELRRILDEDLDEDDLK